MINYIRKSYTIIMLIGLGILLVNWLTDFNVKTGWQVTAIVFLTSGLFIESVISLINNKNKEDEL